MLDLYFSLLTRAGVTGKMLISACERYIMAPAGGKGKFFPDPGQLAELCSDEVRARTRDMQALDSALALLEGAPAAAEGEVETSRRVGLHAIAENLAALTPPPPPLPIAPRAETDATELRTALKKRMGHG